MTEKDHSVVQAFINEQYPTVSENDRSDLVAEAIIYLANNLGEDGNSKDILKRLADHLSDYRRRQQKEHSGISSTARPVERLLSDIRNPYGKRSSDEDKLNYLIKHKKKGYTASDKEEWEKRFTPNEKEELDHTQLIFKRHRSKWRAILPLAEYEALERMTEEDQRPQWTAGIGQLGISMLLRRAQIRMLWEDEPFC